MSQTIWPGIPKFIEVTVLNGQLSGSAYHYMGTVPKCARPNPNVTDGATSTAYASADATTLTVTCEVPVSQDIIFVVPVMV